ncbi:hypothetical protein SK128_005772 [Halocaridina rubra]|uniref:ATP-dependent DNA helicase n=1 Tax=Halocaridina rubra TaxID=373956 RepID=A0AAN9AFU5_HALRR
MRRTFPGTPILGLTATATSRVILDVQKILDIQGCLVLKASFNRPNLFYEVHPKPSSSAECVDELEKLIKSQFPGQSGILYTMSIKDTEELAKELRKRDLKVAPYHAQLTAEARSNIHRKWVQNIYQIVVATIAFGMGIDKPDVRFVIHHCISKSMENFYQESGRSGRDSRPAKCIVYWRFADFARQSTMVFTEQTGLENLYGLISYCLDSSRCRRNIIAEHFDERWETSDCNRMCDHCKTPREVKHLNLAAYGEQLLLILTKAVSKDQRLTGQKLIDAWLGKGAKDARVEGAIAKDLSRERAEIIVAFLIIDSFLKEDFHFTPYNTISYILPGPKAEAGLSPSSMQIGGRRKDLSYKSTSSTISVKESQSTLSKHSFNSSVKLKNNETFVTTDNDKNVVKLSSSENAIQKPSGKRKRENNGQHSDKPQKKMKAVDVNSGSISDSKDYDSTVVAHMSSSNGAIHYEAREPKKRNRIITVEDSSDESDI